MHTGEFTNLGAAIGFYVTAPAMPERDAIPGAGPLHIQYEWNRRK